MRVQARVQVRVQVMLQVKGQVRGQVRGQVPMIGDMRTHTGDKTFACTMCDYRAAQKGNLTRHVKRKHKSAPTAINTRKIRRCAEPFTLFEIKEFATLEESLRSLHRSV